MFEKLLVAVDGSQGAHEALRMVVEMQKTCAAELLAMRQYAREVAEKSNAYTVEQGVDSVRSFYVGGGPAWKIVKFSDDQLSAQPLSVIIT